MITFLPFGIFSTFIFFDKFSNFAFVKFLNKLTSLNCSISELFSPNIFNEHLKCCFKSEHFKIANKEKGLHFIAEVVLLCSSLYISFPNNALFLSHIVLPVLDSINSPSIGTTIREFLRSPDFIISVSFS